MNQQTAITHADYGIDLPLQDSVIFEASKVPKIQQRSHSTIEHYNTYKNDNLAKVGLVWESTNKLNKASKDFYERSRGS